MGDDNLGREFYETMYPRGGRAKKKRLNREQTSQHPIGIFHPRRPEREPNMDALEREFQDELVRAGRVDIALDDSEAYAGLFNKWLKRRGDG